MIADKIKLRIDIITKVSDDVTILIPKNTILDVKEHYLFFQGVYVIYQDREIYLYNSEFDYFQMPVRKNK